MWNHFWHENGMYLRLLNLSMLTLERIKLSYKIPTDKNLTFLNEQSSFNVGKRPSKITKKNEI